MQTGPKKRLLLCFSKKRIKGIMVLVGKDALSVRMSELEKTRTTIKNKETFV